MKDQLDFLTRLLVVISALASPFICILVGGELASYSEYWSSEMRPLFIFTNASTSYFLFSISRWKIPALSLMFLTAFSYDQYPLIHNITAIAFFILCLLIILLDRRYKYWIIPYIASIPILLSFGILWAEIVAISIVCGYHLHRLIAYKNIEDKRKKLKNL